MYHALSVHLFRAKLITRFDDQYAVASPEFRTKFQREVPLFLDISEFPFNTVYDGWKEAHMPKTRSIRSAVSIEHRLVTDGQTDTDGHRPIASTADA